MIKLLKYFLVLFFINFSKNTFSQIGIGTIKPNVSAKLDISSSSKGFLLPKLTTIQRNQIQNPIAGMQIWCIDCGINGQLQNYNGIYWTNAFGINVVASVPSSPINPKAITISKSSAKISFNAPTSNGGSGVISYRIISIPMGIVTTGNKSPIYINGLKPGNIYKFNVEALNQMGYSAPSTTNFISLNDSFYWRLNGNKNTSNDYFIGISNNNPLQIKTNGIKRIDIDTSGTINMQNNMISNYSLNIINKTDSYTLSDQDNGKIITFNSSIPIILTIPAGLPVGFHANILQTGIGQIDFVASNGVVLNNINNLFTTVDTFSMANIMSYANNTLLLSGDLD